MLRTSTTVLWVGAASGIALCGPAAPARGQCEATETGRWAPADGQSGDLFGQAVAVSGLVAVIGAPQDDDAGPQSGSAYVYRGDGGKWIEQAKLAAGGGQPEDAFGEAVAAGGDVVLIGAPGDDHAGPGSGAAYVFRFDGIDWVQEAKLTASDANGVDLFGHGVAVDGSLAAVGAYQPLFGNGAAYVFSHGPTGWIEQAKLTAADGGLDDQFGISIDIADDVVLIGAHRDDDHGDNSGAAYVFRFNWSTGAWEPEAKLTASDAGPGAGFGYAVSISGNVAVVGANNDTEFDESGAAYVFRFDGTSWVEEAKLTAPPTAPPDDEFGRSVSVSGDLAVVGAHHDAGGGTAAGAAYLFAYDGRRWKLAARLGASDPDEYDALGLSVAVDGPSALLGAPYDAPGGSTYTFDGLADGMPDTCACPWDLDESGDVGITDLLRVLGAWGPNAGHAADLDEDGEVGFSDLQVLLGRWGDCP